MKTKAPTGFISKPEAAALLVCSVRSIDQWMKFGMIPYYKFGHRVFFKADELIQAIEGRKIQRGKFPPIAPTWGALAPTPTAPLTEEQRKKLCENAWDKVVDLLNVCKTSDNPKQRRLADACLGFITRFDFNAR